MRGLFKAAREDVQVAAVALVGAAFAAVAPGRPTGLAVWDDVLQFAVAFLFIICLAKGPRSMAIVAATTACAAVAGTIWLLPPAIGLAIALAAIFFRRRNRVIGAAVAAFTIQGLYHIPEFGFFGLASIIAGVTILAAMAYGYRHASRPTRRKTRLAVAIVFLATTLAGIIGAAQFIGARNDVEQGIAAARRGLSAGRDADVAAVTGELADAGAAFGRASDRLSGAAAQPLRFIPIVAQHQQAVLAATEEGEQLAEAAASVIVDADVSAAWVVDGAVDVDRIREMAPRLADVVVRVEAAQSNLEAESSRWLLPAIGGRIDDVQLELEMLEPDARLAAQAADVLPSMLGAEQKQTYLIFFGTPAESREFGGFVGSYAVLRVDGGRLQLGESGRIGELRLTAREATIAPGTASDWFLEIARPGQFPQNLTGSPDFTEVATVARQVLAGVDDDPIDGFIYVDQWAVIDMLELSGPITTEFSEQPLDSTNAADFFFRDQYTVGGVERSELFDDLAVVARTVLDRLTQQTLPGPERLGNILGPAARAGRLQVITFDDAQNDFLREVRLLRDFGRDETSDFVALVQTNSLSNKMDLYLERTMSYEVERDETGALRAAGRVELRSVVPADAPESTLGRDESRGLNTVLLSLYSPHSLTEVTVDGVAVGFRAAQEFGLGRYLIEVTVPPTGESIAITYSLTGSTDAAQPYALEVWHQPLVNNDQVDVSYRGPDGSAEWAGPLVENIHLDPNAGNDS